MNAAELDRYLAAKKAFDEAIACGLSHPAAIEAARQASEKKAREQVLRRVGVDLNA